MLYTTPTQVPSNSPVIRLVNLVGQYREGQGAGDRMTVFQGACQELGMRHGHTGAIVLAMIRMVVSQN